MPRSSYVLYLMLLVVALFFTSALIGTQYLGTITNGSGSRQEITLESFNKLDNKDELFNHINDMKRLQDSIILELNQLEQKRGQLKSSVHEIEQQRKTTKESLSRMLSEMQQIEMSIAELMKQQIEIQKVYPPIKLPHKLNAPTDNNEYALPSSQHICQLHNCFDYSRCSVLSEFPVYVYPSESSNNLAQLWQQSLQSSPYAVDDGDSACIYVVILQPGDDVNRLKTLKYWRGDGRNHLIISPAGQAVQGNQGFRAMRAQSEYKNDDYQLDFDVILPYVSERQWSWENLPLVLPALREYLVTFHGAVAKDINEDKSFYETLSNLHISNNKIKITTDCVPISDCNNDFDWCLCKDYEKSDLIGVSTFTIVISPSDSSQVASHHVYKRLHRSLKLGAIPIILGSAMKLPLADIIPWTKALITLPKPRITELLYILRNILEEDIMEYKRFGRIIYDNYLSTVEKTSEALLSSLRMKLNIPPKPAPTPKSSLIYSNDNPMQTFLPKLEQFEEILGPIEDPFPSRSYIRNFTSLISPVAASSVPIYLYPFTPWDPFLPTDAKFHGSPHGFRPINNGAGGSGTEFSQALGGNHPREQFTIVILTYDRPDMLQQQLAQFRGLPYLNKVLVIWNNPRLPDPMFTWPEIGKPIQVVKGDKNSLNNRFLPFKEIETEAILSMDDDMSLRHDEIVFAFRVWRESRDRLVGFPGRYHAWDINGEQWNYNSNHSCQLSMILTGAAFFHKYFAYQYSYFMPQAIRDKVDEFMNCEDIAMNFLISHLTRKPPIKVTSRWTFRCPTCGETSLWIDESHFNERHKCINFFIKVYGYLPLVYTQYRADSVLFKTKVPNDKKKCFTYV